MVSILEGFTPNGPEPANAVLFVNDDAVEEVEEGREEAEIAKEDRDEEVEVVGELDEEDVEIIPSAKNNGVGGVRTI